MEPLTAFELAATRETIAMIVVAIAMNVVMYFLGRRDGYKESGR